MAPLSTENDSTGAADLPVRQVLAVEEVRVPGFDSSRRRLWQGSALLGLCGRQACEMEPGDLVSPKFDGVERRGLVANTTPATSKNGPV